MKRKVIQIADSTQLVSLPRQWSKLYNIKKGDELEVEEKGSYLTISTEATLKRNEVSINVTDMDRSSIIFYVRSAYRKGYNEIIVNYKNPFTTHLRVEQKKRVSSIIQEEVNRLVGMEIIKQSENQCVIKDISHHSDKEFDIILRRIFILIIEMVGDLSKGLKERNMELITTLEERHDNITNFISYCLRLLNKKGFSDATMNLYYVISNLEKITDTLKWASRDFINFKPDISNNSVKIIDEMKELMRMYYNLFYKFEPKAASELYKLRSIIINKIKNPKIFSGKELILLNNLRNICEIVVNLTETKMCMDL